MIDFIDKTYRQIFKFDTEIGHSYIPNINVRLINEDGGYYIRTNSSGFRSNLDFKENKSKKKRILFFGDSNTAADGVSNEDRYSDLLGESLNAEVFNYAVSGTGTDQQYLIFEKYAKNVEADLIVIGVLVENIERNKVAFREVIGSFRKEKTLISKPYYTYEENVLKLNNSPVIKFEEFNQYIEPKKIQWSVPINHKIIYNLIKTLRKNKIFNFINKKFNPFTNKIRSFLIRNFYQPHKDYQNINSEGYVLMKNIINKFTSSIKKTPIIILPIPTYHYYFDEAKCNFRNFFNGFSNDKKNIYVLDLLEEINKLNILEKKKLSFKEDKSHFSKEGHKLIASFLKKEILKIDIFKNLNIIKSDNPNSNIAVKKSLYILGISAFYHDSAATLIKDGEIIAAAQEERFTRIKNDKSFPINSINFCLERANIQQNNLDAIVYYDNSYLTFERVLWGYLQSYPSSYDLWLRAMPSWIQYKFFIPSLIREKLKYTGKILHNYHHRSHLASAYFPSPYKKSAILSIDGVGEWATASIGIGEDNKITILKEMNYPNSLGLLYSAFTQFTGFKVNSGEYKMMGLAPYGTPKYFDIILNNLVKLNDDGSIEINQKYFNYIEGNSMTNENFSNLFGGKAREPETKITKREMDIASSIQKVTENIILNMAKYVKKITNADYLCLSGGVALNCVANGFLFNQKIFKDIWIQPASGDAGSSLGCAYDVYFTYFKSKRILKDNNKSYQLGSCFGPSWTNDEIKAFLDTENIKYKYVYNNKEKNKLIANYISNGKVIGLFNGRAEFGPRALGSRSIIGDPRNKEMQTKINLKIKYRESFRPFAPAILLEKKNDYFCIDTESPYMMLVAPVVKERRIYDKNKMSDDNMLELVRRIRSDIPAVTHIDYSARVQTVSKFYHNSFYDLIKEFENQTKCPILINTSFNVRGEPIVNTPLESYKCFMNTEMDILVIENFILFKEEQNLSQFKKYSNILTNKQTFKNEFDYQKKLKKIYYKIQNLFIKKKNVRPGWSNYSQEEDIRAIFEIPIELQNHNHNSLVVTKKIISYWKDKEFGKNLEKIIFQLVELSKRFKKEKEFKEFNDFTLVSDKIYEMF